MWAKDRHHRIISLLSVRDRISIDELIADLGVSRESVRRDIAVLESEGKLIRFYGGVARPPPEGEPPLKARMQANSDAKRRIGEMASRLIMPGMLCAVDSGSTTHAFAKSLATVPGITVVTNSINIATLISAVPGSDLILVGGRVRLDMPGTYGELAMAEMARYRPDIAFFSTVALDAEYGASSFHLPEAEFARAMLANAKRVVMLADSSKLGTLNRVQICECKRIHTLVTDKRAKASHLDSLRASGIAEILLA